MLYCESREFDYYSNGRDYTRFGIKNSDKRIPIELAPNPSNHCHCCKNVLTSHYSSHSSSEMLVSFTNQKICSQCDFWYHDSEAAGDYNSKCFLISRLKILDITDVHAPYRQLVSYINSHPGDSNLINPRRFEMLARDVMSEFLSCDLAMTVNSADGGYDLVGYDSERGKILIEVKRYENRKVGVRVVRHLVGAMIRENSVVGSIIGTTDFTGPAYNESMALGLPTQEHPLKIDLIKFDELLPWLEIVHGNLNDSREYDEDYWDRKLEMCRDARIP